MSFGSPLAPVSFGPYGPELVFFGPSAWFGTDTFERRPHCLSLLPDCHDEDNAVRNASRIRSFAFSAPHSLRWSSSM